MQATRQRPRLLKDLVKSQRTNLNLTQRDVARAMGMSSVDYIGMVESGIRRLDFERLPAIAKVLHLDLDQITEMTFRELYGKPDTDRKSTRLNSSHLGISYAVFCLKKK